MPMLSVAMATRETANATGCATTRRRNDGQSILLAPSRTERTSLSGAGVSLEDYPELTITQEKANNDQASSKQVVLSGSAPSG